MSTEEKEEKWFAEHWREQMEQPDSVHHPASTKSTLSSSQSSQLSEQSPCIEPFSPLSTSSNSSEILSSFKDTKLIQDLDDSHFDFFESSLLYSPTSPITTPRFSPKQSQPLKMRAVACMIPHPDKVDKGGEDAYFISEDQRAIGVADGVGGWSLHGVDPSIYSNCLMRKAQEAYDRLHQRDPVDLLEHGFQAAKSITGSSTACVVTLRDDQKIDSANLGDSGFLVIRDNEVFYHSKEQQHMFNFPVQLGTGHTTTPKDADHVQLDVFPGDLIIVASDGLFDNLFDWEILDIVNSWDLEGKSHEDGTSLASELANKAHRRASSYVTETPFTRHAYHLGYLDLPIGGKMDDITVVVAKIEADTTKGKNEEEEGLIKLSPPQVAP